MICAIYARKSTEQHGVTEDAKSVTRQIEHATAYALKKGWTVSEDHIYSDDGISGAEFVKRPSFLRLMNALKPRAPFQVLVMSEESRLGREQIQTAYALQQITDAGVRVFYYLNDQERKLDTAMDKIMGSLAGFASEMEREKTSQRVHDALRKKAVALQVTGCKVYGYDNLEVLSPTGERLHVVRRINREEAAIVRRLFERYVAGDGGLATLAKDLNGEGVPPPRGHRHGWAPSCVRAILHRELYRGVVVWNKTQSIHRGGTQTSRKRPQSEWLTIDAPDLRIIPADLWERVDRKIQQIRQAFARTANGRLCGHPSGADLRSAYLLSGLAKCAICGGSLVAYKRKRGDGKDLYICVFHHKRGPLERPSDSPTDARFRPAARPHERAGRADDRGRRAARLSRDPRGTDPVPRSAAGVDAAVVPRRGPASASGRGHRDWAIHRHHFRRIREGRGGQENARRSTGQPHAAGQPHLPRRQAHRTRAGRASGRCEGTAGKARAADPADATETARRPDPLYPLHRHQRKGVRDHRDRLVCGLIQGPGRG